MCLRVTALSKIDLFALFKILAIVIFAHPRKLLLGSPEIPFKKTLGEWLAFNLSVGDIRQILKTRKAPMPRYAENGPGHYS
ncbi:MAG: hypothetical protein BWY42_01411 [Candidatus Omnitrophica bacterium ADurb.Bin277]|nr:MAG: hypothetical protein BWY42_01411 [Candidatus Omnitrophica bacterium ADurb.Bin277]